jgi:hypothetical protein
MGRLCDDTSGAVPIELGPHFSKRMFRLGDRNF